MKSDFKFINCIMYKIYYLLHYENFDCDIKLGVYMAKVKEVLFILILSVILTGCKRGNTETVEDNTGEGERLTIVTTLFPQYDFARQIAGEYADVVMLLPPGMESHSYDLRPADMIKIQESDIFIYTGKYMEAWSQTIIDSLDGSVMVVDVSEGITLSKETDYYIEEHVHEEEDHEHEADEHVEGEGYEHSGHHHEYDPHIWTNPVYAVTMVENITDALCEKDLEHAPIYRQRAGEYIAELNNLNEDFMEVADNAQSKTIFFGGRFAMSYFVQEYGFDCLAAYHDCSAESEPSIESVMSMIDEIREHGAKAVYYEELADPKVARTISEETGAKLLLLHSAHNVTKEDFDNGITYLDIMWQNVERLKEGLY